MYLNDSQLTIGEYIRSKGDEELAGLLLHWMITVLALLGLDYRKMDLNAEYEELMTYIQTPISEDLESAMKLWDTPVNDILS